MKNIENYDYLQNISKELINQKVRSENNIKSFPIFVVNKNGKDYYFIIREKSQEFIKTYKLANLEIIKLQK